MNYYKSKNKDLMIVFVAVCITYLASLVFNLAETFNEFLSRFEYLQLDEIPITLFVMAIMSAWFSKRRVKEVLIETNLRIETEKHLKSSRHLYKTLFDGDLTGNCVLNLDGEVMMSNSAFNRICNLTLHQHNAKSLFNFDWQSFTEKLTKEVESNYPKVFINRTDNSPCYVIARFIYIPASSEFDSAQDIQPHIHVYLVDITEQCLAEEELEEMLKQNQKLSRHMISIQEKERKFIAQEIHDETGQYLTAIRMDALALQKSSAEKMPEIATRITSNISHVQRSVHALIKQLRPIALNTQGLSEAIKQLVQDWLSHHLTTYFELDLSINDAKFPEEINIVVFRIIQEALTNISKHANASNVRVKVFVSYLMPRPTLNVEIYDNGRGINFSRPSGLGLVGMRERVESLNGQFFIESEKNKGTSISAEIPFQVSETPLPSSNKAITL